jgi:secondary thiamine-phosphate synthase enzyme
MPARHQFAGFEAYSAHLAQPGEPYLTMPLTTFTLATTGPGLYDFTRLAQSFVSEHNPAEALLTVFVRHTSCSLTIQENADPDVQRDLNEFFARLVPDGDDPSMAWLAHTAEGPDDMPAHIKSTLTQTSIGIPVAQGELLLGTWQGIYLFEHRDRPQRREVVLHLAV